MIAKEKDAKHRPARWGASVRFPPKRILVPLDLTAESLAGWRQAQAVAGWFHADLEVLYVQPWVYSAMGLGVAEPYLSGKAVRQAVAELRRRLGPGVVINSSAGDVGDGIVAWAGEGYDLLVMATHGRTGLARAVAGSVAERAVSRSSIPVLVVRKKTSCVRSVLAPVSLEPDSWRGFLAAAHVAESLRARLTALHVVTSGTSGRARVGGLKRAADEWILRLPERIRRACEPNVELAFGSAPERICLAARGADLVVLTAHRRGLLSETVLGTTAERVIRHCGTAVLAIP